MLQVIPNPYRVLDADGKPTAIVPCHSKHAPGEFVGATKTLVVESPAEFVDVTRKVNGRDIKEQKLAAYDRSKASFTFSFEPVSVPAEGAAGSYYLKRVREGSLIAADQATARTCGVPFVQPRDVLAKERAAAAKEFERQFGAVPDWANDTKPASETAPK